MNKSIMDVVHETAKDLREGGAMSEAKMREFDAYLSGENGDGEDVVL